MKKLYRFIFYITVTITFYLSIVPASDIPNIAALNFISDKLIHSLIFFFIAFVGLNCKYSFSDFYLLSSIFIFGLIIEIIHLYHPYRYFVFADLIANLIGILAALFFYKKKIH